MERPPVGRARSGVIDVLSAEGLAALRGERLVFRDLDLSVAPGAALVLEGPNGSGKSTLLRMMAGLVSPAAGRLAWNGEDIREDLPAHARRVTYVGHLDAVKPGLTVGENLRLAAALGGGRLEDALSAMALVELSDLPGRMLSAGQKRRLALSRLVLGGAAVWLLDEPTLGLDTASIARFADLLARHRAGGGIVVAATHVPLPLAGAETFRLS